MTKVKCMVNVDREFFYEKGGCMFGLKKKAEAPKRSKLVVAAPLSGKLIDLSSVNDAVFSKR